MPPSNRPHKPRPFVAEIAMVERGPQRVIDPVGPAASGGPEMRSAGLEAAGLAQAAQKKAAGAGSRQGR